MRQKKLPKYLDEWEREALLQQPNPRYWTGERNTLLIRLMLKTGLRLSEAITSQMRTPKWDERPTDGTRGQRVQGSDVMGRR